MGAKAEKAVAKYTNKKDAMASIFKAAGKKAKNEDSGSAALQRFASNNKKTIIAVIAVLIAVGATAFSLQYREQKQKEAQEQAYQKGTSAYSEGKFDTAITELEKAKQLAPGDAKTHLNLAQSYEAKGELDKALAEYKTSIEADPKQPETLYNLAIIYKSKGDVANAIQSLEAAVAINKEFVAARIALGDLYIQQGETQKAKEQYETVVNLNPYGVDLEDIKQKLKVLK